MTLRNVSTPDCACDSMGTCLAHELSPNRCNCGISWASPTPRPVCPEHGHHRDVEMLALNLAGAAAPDWRDIAPTGQVVDAMGVRWTHAEYFSTPEVM